MRKSIFIGAFVLWANIAFAGGTPPVILSPETLAELYPLGLTANPVRVAPAPPIAQAQIDFLSAFFTLQPTLRKHNVTLERWIREDHVIYLGELLNNSEKEQLVGVFNEIGLRVEAGMTDMRPILVGIKAQLLIAKVAKVDAEVRYLKDLHKDVIRLALSKHESEFNQTYAGQPYSYHLSQVRDVLKRFGFGAKDSYLGLKIGTAAWLHDIVEDTDVTDEEIEQLYGREIADIVLGVTKMESDDLSHNELLELTYARTALKKGSRILKLADRIANVESSTINFFTGEPSIIHKYIREWPMFKRLIYVPGEADEMWLHLERLLTDRAYAQNFVLRTMRERCEVELSAPVVVVPEAGLDQVKPVPKQTDKRWWHLF